MIYWTGVAEFDERIDIAAGSSAARERTAAARRARLLRWSLLVWVSQIVVMAIVFAFD
jgi:hypothetical protein